MLCIAAHRKMKPCGVALRVYNNAYLVLSADRVFKYRILPKRHENKQIVTKYVCFICIYLRNEINKHIFIIIFYKLNVNRGFRNGNP